MKKLCLLLLLLANSFLLQAQDKKTKARELGSRAVVLMDSGQVDESIRLLEEAEQLDPKNHVYPYEMGYAWYLKQNYAKAVVCLERSIKRKGASDQSYQLLGNAYDMQGMRLKALQVYQRGLKKFPHSGRLYLEQGIVAANKKKYDDALALWEKGIEVDPVYPSNYYWATRFYCHSPKKYLGLIYGELFMNLERNTPRTAEIGRLLYTTYQQSIKIKNDSSFSMDFGSAVIFITPRQLAKGRFRLPFNVEFAKTMGLAGMAIAGEGNAEIDINRLVILRKNFIRLWFSEKNDQQFPNVLFDWHKNLIAKEYFQAYNYWLFGGGNESETKMWYTTHEQESEEFIRWFTKNPMEINKNRRFYGRQYD